MCLQFFSHVWKLNVTHHTVPVRNQNLCVVKFILHPTSKSQTSIADQMKHIFPIFEHSYGYCGAAFPHEPPSDAPLAEKMLPQRKEVISMNVGAHP